MKTSDLEQQLNFEAEFGVNQFRDISVPEESISWKTQENEGAR